MGIKIAVVTPDRGDREAFMKHCVKQVERQTRKPDHFIIIDYPPKNAIPDLVPRFREGFEKAFNLYKCDIAICIESDDYYSQNYIETLVTAWENAGRPQLIGLNRTIYYNIFTNKYVVLSHPGRASMMSTAVTPAILFHKWCADEYTYLDWHLWVNDKTLKKVSVSSPHVCIGIKHGIGLCGGGGHTTDWAHYSGEDKDWKFFDSIVTDEKDREFYRNLNKSQNVQL